MRFRMIWGYPILKQAYSVSEVIVPILVQLFLKLMERRSICSCELPMNKHSLGNENPVKMQISIFVLTCSLSRSGFNIRTDLRLPESKQTLQTCCCV